MVPTGAPWSGAEKRAVAWSEPAVRQGPTMGAEFDRRNSWQEQRALCEGSQSNLHQIPAHDDPAASPRQQHEVAAVGVVVRMLVGDQDMSEGAQRHAANTICRATPSPQSTTYDVSLARITWAGAERTLRGRGPPPVPRRMSRVLGPGLLWPAGSRLAPANAVAAQEELPTVQGRWHPELLRRQCRFDTGPFDERLERVRSRLEKNLTS